MNKFSKSLKEETDEYCRPHQDVIIDYIDKHGLTDKAEKFFDGRPLSSVSQEELLDFVADESSSKNESLENTKINIRESLNKIDIRTDNKYDLRNLYDSCIMDDKEKRIIAEMIYNKARADVLYETLMNKFEGKSLTESLEESKQLKESLEDRMGHKYATACQIDFFHNGDYDLDLLRDRIDFALQDASRYNVNSNYDWSGYLNCEAVKGYETEEDRLGFKYASAIMFDVFNDGDFDPDILIDQVDQAIIDMGCDWYRDISAEDNTDAYEESLKESDDEYKTLAKLSKGLEVISYPYGYAVTDGYTNDRFVPYVDGPVFDDGRFNLTDKDKDKIKKLIDKGVIKSKDKDESLKESKSLTEGIDSLPSFNGENEDEFKQVAQKTQQFVSKLTQKAQSKAGKLKSEKLPKLFDAYENKISNLIWNVFSDYYKTAQGLDKLLSKAVEESNRRAEANSAKAFEPIGKFSIVMNKGLNYLANQPLSQIVKKINSSTTNSQFGNSRTGRMDDRQEFKQIEDKLADQFLCRLFGLDKKNESLEESESLKEAKSNKSMETHIDPYTMEEVDVYEYRGFEIDDTSNGFVLFYDGDDCYFDSLEDAENFIDRELEE